MFLSHNNVPLSFPSCLSKISKNISSGEGGGGKPKLPLDPMSKKSSLSGDVFFSLLGYYLWLWAEWNSNRRLEVLPAAMEDLASVLIATASPASVLGKQLLVCTGLSYPVVLLVGAAYPIP